MTSCATAGLKSVAVIKAAPMNRYFMTSSLGNGKTFAFDRLAFSVHRKGFPPVTAIVAPDT
jgi:hypothetical protein